MVSNTWIVVEGVSGASCIDAGAVDMMERYTSGETFHLLVNTDCGGEAAIILSDEAERDRIFLEILNKGGRAMYIAPSNNVAIAWDCIATVTHGSVGEELLVNGKRISYTSAEQCNDEMMGIVESLVAGEA